MCEWARLISRTLNFYFNMYQDIKYDWIQLPGQRTTLDLFEGRNSCEEIVGLFFFYAVLLPLWTIYCIFLIRTFLDLVKWLRSCWSTPPPPKETEVPEKEKKNK